MKLLNSSLWHQKWKRKGFTSIRKVFSLGKERENEKKSISTQKKSNSTSEEKYFYIEKKSIYIKKTGRKEKEKKSISTHPKNQKNFKKYFFCKNSFFFGLKLNCRCSQLYFEVYISSVAQNFQF